MTNIPRELSALPKAQKLFQRMTQAADDPDVATNEVTDSFRGLMETCLTSGMPDHVRKAVRKAAIAAINDSWPDLGDAVEELVPDTAQQPAPVNRIPASGWTLSPDATMLLGPGNRRLGLGRVLEAMGLRTYMQSFRASSDGRPDATPQAIAQLYGHILKKTADGADVGDGMIIPQEQVLALMDATLDAWKPGLSRKVHAIAASLPAMENPVANVPMGPEQKPEAHAPAGIKAPAPQPVRAEAKEQTLPPKRIALHGKRADSNPYEDGALHQIQVIPTGFGEVAITTGPGIPKEPTDILNRDAVAMKWDGKTVTLAAADGVGDADGSDGAAQAAADAAVDAPTFEEEVLEQWIRSAIKEADLAKGAATCISAVRIKRGTGGTYDLEDIQSGDTTMLILFEDGSETISDEQNLARAQRDLETSLRGLGALTDGQTVNDLAADFDVSQLDDVDRMHLLEIRRLIAKYGWESYVRRAPHRLTNDMDADEGYVEYHRFDGIPPGAIVLVGTDGVFDNVKATEVIDDIKAREKKLTCKLTMKEILEIVTELAIKAMKGDGKPDNIGIAGVRLA